MYQSVRSWPVADGRASIAGCGADKLADCHDGQLSTRSGYSASYLCQTSSRSPSTNPTAIPSRVLSTLQVLFSSTAAITILFTASKHASQEREENATGIASIRGVAAQTSLQAQSLPSVSKSEEPISSTPNAEPSFCNSYRLNENARTDAGTPALVELVNQALKSSSKTIFFLISVYFKCQFLTGSIRSSQHRRLPRRKTLRLLQASAIDALQAFARDKDKNFLAELHGSQASAVLRLSRRRDMHLFAQQYRKKAFLLGPAR